MARARRDRSSNTPVGRRRVITPYDIDERYLEVLLRLEPYHHFKYATAPWLRFLTGINVEYSVFRKYLGYLREEPNHYLHCPDQQEASPNVLRKELVYQLAERGFNELIERGLVKTREPLDTDASAKPRRARAFAQHRAHSYYHEIIVDLGYYAPLIHLVRNDSALRLVEFAKLLTHENVPHATRAAHDPLLVQLKNARIRFDGTPHVIVRSHDGGTHRAIGIPGIQVDRGTESFTEVERHLTHAIEFVEDRHHERHWGFDNCLVPFLFTKNVRKERAMQLVKKLRGSCPFLLFNTIPDIGLMRLFPKPHHYDRAHVSTGEPKPPETIHIFTNPWQRVGYPDFRLDTFSEVT